MFNRISLLFYPFLYEPLMLSHESRLYYNLINIRLLPLPRLLGYLVVEVCSYDKLSLRTLPADCPL